jgi:pimeloyl-ACP methyl ester carboxylesterase
MAQAGSISTTGDPDPPPSPRSHPSLMPRVEPLGEGFPCVRFGHAASPLVVLPGLGDALRPATQVPLYTAWAMRAYAWHFDVHVVCRRRPLPAGYGLRDMAADALRAIDRIGGPVHLLGVSMGSAIAQYLAAAAPDRVRTLVLALAGPCGDSDTVRRIQGWVDLARAEDWVELDRRMADDTFSGLHHALWRRLIPILVPQPESPADFIASLEACMHHDARGCLGSIDAPTFVIGGTEDRLVPAAQFHELARLIPRARLKLIEGGAHGIYAERRSEFQGSILKFLLAHDAPAIACS